MKDYVKHRVLCKPLFRAGTYQISPVQRIRKRDETLELWTAMDALVLKAIALVLTRQLAPQLPATCHHLVGNGGVKAAVRAVAEQLTGNTFVFRRDVKRYYASINHDILFAQLQGVVDDPYVLYVLWQCLRRTVVEDGLYAEVICGISLGRPLSPLFGALYLQRLDEQMARTGLMYARFIDDWAILAPTRWKLRAAIQQVNTILAELRVEQHPDKTFIGRIARGF